MTEGGSLMSERWRKERQLTDSLDKDTILKNNAVILYSPNCKNNSQHKNGCFFVLLFFVSTQLPWQIP